MSGALVGGLIMLVVLAAVFVVASYPGGPNGWVGRVGRGGLVAVLLAVGVAVVGVSIVLLFMVVYYRLPGSLAAMALIVYALINFAIFLYNSESQTENRDRIIELMMEFEKCWFKRKGNGNEFDENVMKSATILAKELNLAPHLSWLKNGENPGQPEVARDVATDRAKGARPHV